MALVSNPYGQHVVWIELTSYVTLHQARLSNTLHATIFVTTCSVADLCSRWSLCNRSYRGAKQHQIDTWNSRSWLHLRLSSTPNLAWWFWGFNTAHRQLKQQHKYKQGLLFRACCVPCLLLSPPILLTYQISGQASLGPSTSKLSYIDKKACTTNRLKEPRQTIRVSEDRTLGWLSGRCNCNLQLPTNVGAGRFINSI